jgi:GTP 3',8-cyclase
MTPTPLAPQDRFGRGIDYLRVSITDQCNERCLYCRPAANQSWTERGQHLSRAELQAVGRAAYQFGFRSFRITGGEPLLRRDCLEIVRDFAELGELRRLAFSTNGLLLSEAAAELKAAGVTALNVSLDSLDAQQYREITGGDLMKVLRGLESALGFGFASIKLNAVLLRGMSEEQIWPLACYAAEHGMPLRLIELMPLTDADVLRENRFLSAPAAQRILAQHDRLIPLPEAKLGDGPASYYRLEKCGAVVGFIGALTNLHFCQSCNKMRLTADGMLRPCLGQHGETDLKSALRPQLDQSGLLTLFQKTLAEKPENHLFREGFAPLRPMIALGG